MEKKAKELEEEKLNQLREIVDEVTVQMVFTGKRPDWISFEDYKRIRKELKNKVEHYKKGRFLHKSVEIVRETDKETGKDKIIRKNYGPYVKNTAKES